MFRLLAALLAVSLASAAHAACPSTNAALVDAMDRASTHFIKLDIEAFQAQVQAGGDLLACLGEPLSRTNAAAWHRTRGLAQFLDRDSPAARRSFAAARSIEPDYTFPTDMVPTGNPILEDYVALDPVSGASELVPAPRTGAVRLDGSGSLNRSRARPVIFQLLDGRGAVLHTQLLDPGDPLPLQVDAVTEARPDRRRRPHLPLLVGAGVGALAAGGLYAGSAVARSGYDRSTQVDGLGGRRAATNALAVGSGVTAAVAVGLCTSSFLLSGRF